MYLHLFIRTSDDPPLHPPDASHNHYITAQDVAQLPDVFAEGDNSFLDSAAPTVDSDTPGWACVFPFFGTSGAYSFPLVTARL
jgi:hypothetical protein